MTTTLAPPTITDRDRRRAALAFPALEPGHYLAVEGGEEIVVLPVDAGRVTSIGRSPIADVLLDDVTVSRRHARLLRRGDALAVVDDRSTNGLIVNGDRVAEAVLGHGDEITLGRVTLRYLEIA